MVAVAAVFGGAIAAGRVAVVWGSTRAGAAPPSPTLAPVSDPRE